MNPADLNPAQDDFFELPESEGENNWTPTFDAPIAEAVHILVADDDEDDRLLTADALRAAKLLNPVDFVANGEELMDYLEQRGQYAQVVPAPRPKLLFLDLNMPRKSGREALQEIKSNPDLRSIVVIVLTTSETQDDIDQIYAQGANSYIPKPVTFEGLVKAMQIVGEYWFQLVRLPEVGDGE